jgi:hypothetical protein
LKVGGGVVLQVLLGQGLVTLGCVMKPLFQHALNDVALTLMVARSGWSIGL